MVKPKTLEEQQRLCKAWQQSGLTRTEFCLLNKLNRSSFYKWLKELCIKNANPAAIEGKLKARAANKDNLLKFLKMPAPLSSSISREPCCLEITLPNGVGFNLKLPPNNIDKFLAGLLTWK